MGPISQEIITYIKITAIFVTVQVNSAVAILTVFIYKIDHFFPLYGRTETHVQPLWCMMFIKVES